ncbi:uncharacterized protein LOC132607914 [Lycium barbarum]|uniref:uncharacterized protein LOC132607914 n=1 Tax=Lycium barbarum TaxID=112863 RepID=UPI00293E28BD|nr:uncharacterized protein LOC132607914 [Lycium barbarum]
MVTVPEDCSFLSRPVGVASYSVVLVNESFLRAQHEIDDLRGQLDAQGRETEKFKLLLQQKEDQLSRIIAPPTLQSELEAAKKENLRLKIELDDIVKKSKVLEGDNKQLSRENAEYATKLGEFEATITQLREGLDSVKGEAAKMEEKFRKLKVEKTTEKDKLKVMEEKAESRARIDDELKKELEAAVLANDALQAELASSNEVRVTLVDMRSELEEKLKKAQADLEEAYKEIVATEARSTLLVEHERWKSRRVTLEAVQRGFEDLPARILDTKMIEDRAKKALEDSSEKDPEGSGSDDSGSSLTE